MPGRVSRAVARLHGDGAVQVAQRLRRLALRLCVHAEVRERERLLRG